MFATSDHTFQDELLIIGKKYPGLHALRFSGSMNANTAMNVLFTAVFGFNGTKRLGVSGQ